METLKIILEYLKVLIWPIIFLILIIKYHKHFNRLFERFSEEGEEIQSTFLGINAKFRKEVSDITKNENIDPHDLKKQLGEKVNTNVKDEFRILASNYYTNSLTRRVQIDNEIAKISEDLSIEDLIEFTASPLLGERMGGFTGIRIQLIINRDAENNRDVIETLRFGLTDKNSLVRYRAIQALGKSEKLKEIFSSDLSSLFNQEPNAAVRTRIKKILGIHVNLKDNN